LGRDKVGDLAALKLEPKAGEQLPFLELGDSESLRIGDTALAVGNPFGLGMVDQSPTFTLGVISALHYLHGNYTECLVTDAEVNPGNSGGPLLNRSGQVVGINGQISTRWGLRSNTGLGYAISARQIRLWLPRLEAAQGGEVQHGRLSGLAFAGGAGGLPASLTVKDVADNSPAAAAGFRPGDTIVRLDGQRVANAARLASLIGIYPADHEVTFEVRRGDKDVSLKVKLPALRRSQLGISLAAPTEQDAHVKVSGVAKDSAAEKGGVKVGDEILEVGGAELKLPVLVQHKLLEAWLKNGVSAGDIVQLKVRRTNEKKEPSEMTLRIVPQ
jgi:S1-C subfamily serine protease